MAGDIAHELNNRLLGISGLADLVLEHVRPDSPLRPHLEEIGIAAERAGALARRLLAFARSPSVEPQPVAPNELLSNLETLLRALLGDGVDLRLELESPIGTVFVNPEELERAVVELVLEARRELPLDGREIVIATSLSEPAGGATGSQVDGRFASITIRHAVAGGAPEAARWRVGRDRALDGDGGEVERLSFASHVAAQAGGRLLRGGGTGPLAELRLPLRKA